MSTANRPLMCGSRLPELMGGQPHVWVADLGALPPSADWGAVLSVDEQKRLGQYRFEVHRRRCLIARSVLRMLLGRYLELHPAEIAFTYGAKGKPHVAGAQIEFNISHAEDLCLFAFAHSPIGVDVDRVRHTPDYVEIADRFFSADEAQRLRAEDPKIRDEAFFRCWTRKEAVMKALGVGLSFGLDRFSVSLDEPACVLRWGDDDWQASDWRLFHLDPAPGYVAAVATTAPCDAPLVFSQADLLAQIGG